MQAATESSYKQFNASGGSCGAKLLTAGDFNETYLVCISDETDPSEWVVVIEKKSQATKKLAARDCVVKYAGVQYDSQTPHFESEEGLLKTKECSVSDNGKGTSKVTCQ